MSSIKSTHSQRPGHPKQGSSYEKQQKLASLQELGLLPRKAGERPFHTSTNKRSKHPPSSKLLLLISSLSPETVSFCLETCL